MNRFTARTAKIGLAPGRGFAVVADEVQQLAAKSASASR